jgi:hypothetical protein
MHMSWYSQGQPGLAPKKSNPKSKAIQNEAMKRKNDVIECAKVVLQPNKKRQTLKEASNLLKRRSFRKLFVNIENEINL